MPADFVTLLCSSTVATLTLIAMAFMVGGRCGTCFAVRESLSDALDQTVRLMRTAVLSGKGNVTSCTPKGRTYSQI